MHVLLSNYRIVGLYRSLSLILSCGLSQPLTVSTQQPLGSPRVTRTSESLFLGCPISRIPTNLTPLRSLQLHKTVFTNHSVHPLFTDFLLPRILYPRPPLSRKPRLSHTRTYLALADLCYLFRHKVAAFRYLPFSNLLWTGLMRLRAPIEPVARNGTGEARTARGRSAADCARVG
ncbi:hypothetical protein BV25DRAFT_892805 [Artomyces pyxidatus]|uniref:Uncharacterized protein n=1 Tax=Artomyces pyxidatus TaxID=48021 RepID=A0ACB8THL0_9AGAM|nr:hypothetical protein BV25DRAFT_892805 [Artomyces pyxidatus]